MIIYSSFTYIQREGEVFGEEVDAFRRVPTKAEGELFKSPVFVSVYITGMQHCRAVLNVPSLTVTDSFYTLNNWTSRLP